MTARTPVLPRTVFSALVLGACVTPSIASAWNSSAVQPDLAIVDAQLAPANPDRLRVRVANLGLAPAVETQLTLVYHRDGKATPMVAPVPLLKAGERHWLIVEIGAPLAQADGVTLRIDEPPAVIESDETNNTYLWSQSRR